MVNFMQSNQDLEDGELKIIEDDIWIKLYDKIKNKEPFESLILFINEISKDYNIDKKNMIKNFLNYIIRNYKISNSTRFLNFIENIVHLEDGKNDYYINYSLIKLLTLLNES